MRVKNLKRWTNFNDELIGLHLQKTKVVLNKPIYLGQNILDDSKTHMANFHYNCMKTKIDEGNLKLLFTDTDSLCYHIKHQDIYEIMNKNKDEFDLSNYDEEHFLYDEKNKKEYGKFKNESAKHEIIQFVGLRSKLYSYKKDNHKQENRCKGTKKSVAKTILFDQYKDSLFNHKKFDVSQNVIRAYKHNLYSETVSKTALSFNDDKRYILDDNIHTYSFGHRCIHKKI
jgi:hypothetical protein